MAEKINFLKQLELDTGRTIAVDLEESKRNDLFNDLESVSKQNLFFDFLGSETMAFLSTLNTLDGANSNFDLEEKQGVFNDQINKMMKLLQLLEGKVKKSDLNKLRKVFISDFYIHLKKSDLIRRFIDKPRGYPGDYFMFESVYEGVINSDGIGKLIDNYVMSHDLTQSIISRKNKMRNILLDSINNHSSSNVLNVGCGSSREIFELVSNGASLNGLSLTLVDQDKEALKLSKDRLPAKNNIHLYEESIMGVVGFGDVKDKGALQDKDLIYSMGVVDYFLDNVLEKFIESAMGYLKPGGELIFANCSKNNSIVYVAMDWLYDWFIHKRAEDEVLDFIQQRFTYKNVKVVWEETNQIFFIRIKKA